MSKEVLINKSICKSYTKLYHNFLFVDLKTLIYVVKVGPKNIREKKNTSLKIFIFKVSWDLQDYIKKAEPIGDLIRHGIAERITIKYKKSKNVNRICGESLNRECWQKLF